MAIDLLTGRFTGEVPVIIPRVGNDTAEQQPSTPLPEVQQTADLALERARHDLVTEAQRILLKQGIDPYMTEERLPRSHNNFPPKKSKGTGVKRSRRRSGRQPQRVDGIQNRIVKQWF